MRSIASIITGTLLVLTVVTARAAEVQPRRPAPVLADHTVKQGETLWSLALHYGLSVREIREVNKLARDREPAVGSTIKVPLDPLLSPMAASVGGLKAPSRGVPALIKAEGAARAEEAKEPASNDEADEPGTGSEMTSDLVRVGRSGLAWPVHGTILSRFGKRHRRKHTGVDIKADRGTPIHAVMAGRVIFSGVVRGHGKVIVLEHDDGFCSVYSHNQKNLVQGDLENGDRVETGQVIGTVGRSGNATTCHVHFEIRRFEEPVDPIPYLTGDLGFQPASRNRHRAAAPRFSEIRF